MTDFILNNLPWFWVTVMLGCIIIESLTFSLTTIWFACGALVTTFVSLTPAAFRWQLIIFVGVSCILLVLTRPLAMKRFRQKNQPRTNADAVIGTEGEVVKAVTPIEKGEIKCGSRIWAAQSADGTGIPLNTICRIISIKGNTVQILPVEKHTAV